MQPSQSTRLVIICTLLSTFMPEAAAGPVAYSPYASSGGEKGVLWGDTHLHTALSLDARAFGVTLDPDAAYRIARGEEVTSSHGLQVKRSRPLDFLVVADHSDATGTMSEIIAGNPEFIANDVARGWYERLNADAGTAFKARMAVMLALTEGTAPDRWSGLVGQVGEHTVSGREMVSSGYAAVWATENTREAIFDPMQRRETYATTGPRMTVRFDGGFSGGSEQTVPMGGELPRSPNGNAPVFSVSAMKDPIGANLDRIQIIKGWVENGGKTGEQVYDVVWSGDRQQGSDGKLSAVGNSVDPGEASYANTIGASTLSSEWQDPDFNAGQAAFYYARVLEIPTPRWTAYDAKRYAVSMNAAVPMQAGSGAGVYLTNLVFAAARAESEIS